MNKSYKLLGIVYDKLSESKKDYIVYTYDSRILDITEKICLFDVDNYIRKINLSFLFSIESKDKLDYIINQISKVDELYLVLDVCSCNKIIDTFINKRIKQILKLLENKCNNIILVK